VPAADALQAAYCAVPCGLAVYVLTPESGTVWEIEATKLAAARRSLPNAATYALGRLESGRLRAAVKRRLAAVRRV